MFRSFDDDKENDANHSEEFYYVPRLDITSQDDMGLRLAEFLHTSGFALNSFRRVACVTNVSLSFADDTPGEEKDSLCVHAIVDRTNQLKQQDNLEALFMYLPELSRLSDVIFSAPVVRYGLAKICIERGWPVDFA